MNEVGRLLDAIPSTMTEASRLGYPDACGPDLRIRDKPLASCRYHYRRGIDDLEIGEVFSIYNSPMVAL